MPSPDERFDAWKLRPGRATLAPLLEATQDRVFNICFKILRHRQDAEEAKQEVLLEIASGIGDVADGAHFERWVGKVAFRTALDKRRMRLRRSARELQAAGRTPNGNGPDDALHEGMSRLDDEDRVLLIERYFDRRTLREIGERRGISAVAARKRIRKAQERLKRMLGGAVAFIPGDVISAGVIAMKLKTFANAATVVLLLLVVAGGAWMVMAPSIPEFGIPSPSNANRRVEVNPSHNVHAGPVREPAPERKIDAVHVPEAPTDRARSRAEILACLERLTWVSRRAAECKEHSREALTEEEGRRLQRESVALNSEYGPLYTKLGEMASQDPATIVDLVRMAHDIPERRSLSGLIAPEVNAEIGSEDAPSGPLLSGLLTQANGDTEDRMYLAAFAGQLTRANRDLGRVLLTLMNDPDHIVRMNAASSLCELARGGSLKEFLAEQSAILRELSMRDLAPSDHQVRGGALRALAALKVDSADDFVLQRFEEFQSRSDAVYGIQAAIMVALRMAARNETRLLNAILTALNLPFEKDIHYGLRHMAYALSAENREYVLRIIDSKTPDPAAGLVSSSFVVSRQFRGRGMTGVSRLSYDSPR